jgi:hypothetical protein
VANRKRRSHFREALLYVAVALFLAFPPSWHQHPLVRIGLLWILCLFVIGRIVQAHSAKNRARVQTDNGVDDGDTSDHLAVIVAAASYAALVVLMWGPFAFSSGMGYETGFSYTSEINSWLSGFVGGDPTRPFTNVFYHTAYLLGIVFRIPGSFVPFQFVYAMLWVARGVLIFIVLRRLCRGYDFICYMTGAFVIVHASDGALQWVGQMNQFGYIFWLVLAAYLLLRALESTKPLTKYVWTVLACHCEVLCLWSYESGLPILFLIPALFLLVRRNRYIRRVSVCYAAWYGVIIVYACLSVLRYLHGGPSTYQETVMRSNWRVSSLWSDFLFNLRSSLFFWSWPDVAPLDLRRTVIVVLAAGTTAVFILGGILLATQRGHTSGPALGANRTLGVLFVCGFAILIASFPAYLLLASARMLWRTQFLSGLGSAMMFASAIALIVNRIGPRSAWFRWLGYVACLCLSSFVIYAGAHRAVELGSLHRMIWERHRRVMAEVIRTAPQVKSGTVFILCGIRRDSDPFGDSMWFDMALRLAYPGAKVSGSYYYVDGAPAPGDAFMLRSGRWISNNQGFQPLIEEAPAGDALVIRYSPRASRILTTIPAFLCSGKCAAGEYKPDSRITSTEASPRAINRYGPL